MSSHRSPQYPSRSTEPDPGDSYPSTPVSGSTLILTPKSLSQLTPKSLSPSPAASVDPNPDWTLEDLRRELDVIDTRYSVPVTWGDRPPPFNANGISWRAPAADFGRKSATFRMRAFDTDSDEDSDEEEEKVVLYTTCSGGDLNKEPVTPPEKCNSRAQQETEATWRPLLTRTDSVEAALLELERERLMRVQEEVHEKRLSFEEALKEEVLREAASLARVEKETKAKFEFARRNDKQDLRLIAEARDMHLSRLQRDHELRSQFEARQIRKEAAEEEARRREIAAREEKERHIKARAEAEAKQRADAEKEKAETEAAQRKAQAAAAAAAAQQRLEAENKVKQEADRKASESEAQSKQPAPRIAATGARPRVAPSAIKLEKSHNQKLRELQQACEPLQANQSNAKELKFYERLIIKHLQQVAATQEQVKRKSMDLLQLLCDPNAPTQFLIVTLGSKLLSQCESQVLKLPSFAFALSQVIVNVASQVPYVMDVVLAKLHEVCIFTVPKAYVFSKDQFETDHAYYKTLGYREDNGKLESTDEYVARMTAYMTFYGAMVQTVAASGKNPLGLADGWAWCARLLNHIPSDRASASALEAFLKMTGFRLYQAYPKAFMKLMQVVVSDFIVNLKNGGDPDSRAVVNRLETYLHTQQFLQEPEGRNMPATDFSSVIKA